MSRIFARPPLLLSVLVVVASHILHVHSATTTDLLKIGPTSFIGSFTRVELEDFLRSVAQAHGDIATLTSLGKSYESRDILGLCLGACGSDVNVPQVFFNAMHHSREPVSMMTLVYFIQYLVNGYLQKDAEVGHLLRHRQMWFVPLVNPDGYEYNINHNRDHWQRKNRRPSCGRHDSHQGVDLNRNYPTCFSEPGGGSSTNPCAEDYRGRSPFSEPETKAVKRFVESHNFTIAFNFHSYGHLMLLPYSCRSQRLEKMPTKDRNFFVEYGKKLVFHTKYKLGRSYDKAINLYPVNGDAADWMYNQHGIFAVSPEVGGSGFWVNAKLVAPLSKENIPLCTYGALAAGPVLSVVNLALAPRQSNQAEVCLEFAVRNDGLWSSIGDHVTAFLVVERANNVVKNSTSKLPRALAKMELGANGFKECFPRYTDVTVRIGAYDSLQCVSYEMSASEIASLLSGQTLSLEEDRAKRSDAGTALCPGSTLGKDPPAPPHQERPRREPIRSNPKDKESPFVALILLFSTIVIGCFCGMRLHRQSDIHKYDGLNPEEIDPILPASRA